MWQKVISLILLLMLCANLNAARKKLGPKLVLAIDRNAKGNDSYRKMTPCQKLQKDWELNSFRAEPKELNFNVKLIWEESLELAAAALLRATLIAAGYNSSLIELEEEAFINPRRRRHITNTIQRNNDLIVQTMASHMHVRLNQEATKVPACYNSTSWAFYQDQSLLKKCGFSTPGPRRRMDGIIYFVNDWDERCAEEFIVYAESSTQLQVQGLERLVLEKFIRDSSKSILFIDNYIWTNSTNVRLLKIRNYGFNGNYFTNCAEISQEFSVSAKIPDNLPVPEEFLMFSPTTDQLKKLEIYHNKSRSTMKEAACNWAKNNNHIFKNWQIMTKPRTAVLITCSKELQEIFAELFMTGILEGYTNTYVSTLIDRRNILIQQFLIDCTKTDWLVTKLLYWLHNQFSFQIESIIVPFNLAEHAATLLNKVEIPLLTYDMSSGSTAHHLIRSVTGRVDHYVLALRRLLAACDWQRLAIISDQSPLSKALSAALTSTTQLMVREINVTSEFFIPIALNEFAKAEAKVYFVNTGPTMATKVLAAAQKLNLTWFDGYTWIVREYDKQDKATSVIKPYSVSFWWRGERETLQAHKYVEETTDPPNILLKTIEEKWRGKAWPLHAASILDALLTIKRGARQNINQFESNPNSQPRTFWKNIIGNQVQGIKGNLSYDELGVIAPQIFVLQWDSKPRPRLLVSWRSGEWPTSNETCPAINPSTDGSTACIISQGDPFHPDCHDALWIFCFCSVSVIFMVLVIAAVRWSRKAMLAHDRKIKTECTKRILARRERVFEALAKHLVDRSALELLQELGTGRFGRVHHGLLRQSGRRNRNINIAAKTLREEASSAEESEFLREACTLAELDHQHIIRFVGVCIVDGPPLLLMEHAFFGDLLRYLRTRRSLAVGTTQTETTNDFENEEKEHVSAKALTKLAHEAASALAYLAQRGIVHRDVRASNCLIDEHRCLKLADFGLARSTGTVDGEYACRRGLFPVLWMAPETLDKGVSSAASEVWSFGVLIFELVTLGRRPYGSKAPSSVVQHVIAGGRPGMPWDASAETRALVSACWRREPEGRPTAAQLAVWLGVRWRALRPALVDELVDVDDQLHDNICMELHL